MRWLIVCCVGCTSALVPGIVAARERRSSADTVTAFRGALIYPVSGPRIERGVMLVQNGKVVGIGPEDRVPVPEGATIHELHARIEGLLPLHATQTRLILRQALTRF